VTTTATMTTEMFLVTFDGRDGEVFPDQAAAVRAAKSRPESWVVCVSENGGYTTRQRVWPTVGPVYSGHG